MAINFPNSPANGQTYDFGQDVLDARQVAREGVIE